MKATKLEVVTIESGSEKLLLDVARAAKLEADLSKLTAVGLSEGSIIRVKTQLVYEDLNGHGHEWHLSRAELVEMRDALRDALRDAPLRADSDLPYRLDVQTGEVSQRVEGKIVPPHMLDSQTEWNPMSYGSGTAWTLDDVRVDVFRINTTDVILVDGSRIQGPVYHNRLAALRARIGLRRGKTSLEASTK